MASIDISLAAMLRRYSHFDLT